MRFTTSITIDVDLAEYASAYGLSWTNEDPDGDARSHLAEVAKIAAAEAIDRLGVGARVRLPGSLQPSSLGVALGVLVADVPRHSDGTGCHAATTTRDCPLGHRYPEPEPVRPEPEPVHCLTCQSHPFHSDRSMPGCHTCEASARVADLIRDFPEPVDRCPACGDVIDYCQGHGEIGDPAGRAILDAHDEGDHRNCDPRGCLDLLAD